MKPRKDSYVQPPYTTYRYDKPTPLESGLTPITIVGLESDTKHIIMREPLELRKDIDCVAILKDMIRRAEKDVSKKIH